MTSSTPPHAIATTTGSSALVWNSSERTKDDAAIAMPRPIIVPIVATLSQRAFPFDVTALLMV